MEITKEHIINNKKNGLPYLCKKLGFSDPQLIIDKLNALASIDAANAFITVEEIKLIKNSEEYKINTKKEELCKPFLEKLDSLDYKGQKFIDGEYTDEEWATIKAERQSLRVSIRAIEGCNSSQGLKDLEENNV